MHERTNEQMNELTKQQRNEGTNKWTNEWIDVVTSWAANLAESALNQKINVDSLAETYL